MQQLNSDDLQDDLNSKEYTNVFLLDISNFAAINKEHGKLFSDEVLVAVFHMLAINVSKDSKLYKVESDRFVILTKDTDIEYVQNYCKQIISFFDTQGVEVEGKEVNITFSIGVAFVLDDSIDTIINAEYALDKSKNIGSRNFSIYSEDDLHTQNKKDALKWLNITRDLIANDMIIPYFQPIQEISTSKITKYEVLARANLDGEIIEPMMFVYSAKKLGLLSSITKIIINKSFDYFKDKDCDFSINLTERDLIDGYLVGFLTEKLKVYNINPTRVTFEILENVVLEQNTKVISSQVIMLKEMGFSIAVDDFGIENSNFSRLLDLNIDIIKIDGAFIKDLKDNEKTRLIVQTIVNLAKSLGMETVAEYVKDEYTYEAVKMFGLDYAQGYFIGKALPEI